MFGFLPKLQGAAVQTVPQQAEALSSEWRSERVAHQPLGRVTSMQRLQSVTGGNSICGFGSNAVIERC